MSLDEVVERLALSGAIALRREAFGEDPERLADGLFTRELGAATRGALKRRAREEREERGAADHSIARGCAAEAMTPSSGELALA